MTTEQALDFIQSNIDNIVKVIEQINYNEDDFFPLNPQCIIVEQLVRVMKAANIDMDMLQEEIENN